MFKSIYNNVIKNFFKSENYNIDESVDDVVEDNTDHLIIAERLIEYIQLNYTFIGNLGEPIYFTQGKIKPDGVMVEFFGHKVIISDRYPKGVFDKVNHHFYLLRLNERKQLIFGLKRKADRCRADGFGCNFVTDGDSDDMLSMHSVRLVLDRPTINLYYPPYLKEDIFKEFISCTNKS